MFPSSTNPGVSIRVKSLFSFILILFNVAYHEDLVINGLGFIKIVEKAKINVYINKDVEVFTRDSLI